MNERVREHLGERVRARVSAGVYQLVCLHAEFNKENKHRHVNINGVMLLYPRHYLSEPEAPRERGRGDGAQHSHKRYWMRPHNLSIFAPHNAYQIY